MKRSSISLAALAVTASLAFATTSATAGVEPTPFRVTAGFENPVVLFGFNPQPEPPPAGFTGITLATTPDSASLTAGNLSNPQMFELIFGISTANGATVVAPPEPAADYGQLTLAIDTGLQTLFAVFDFTTTSGGIVSSIDDVSFNPQPEPPPASFAPYDMFGQMFSFTSLSDATVTLTIQDANGGRLGLTALPEPASVLLVAFGLAGLGFGTCRRVQARS
jgi:hypothetical protein